jgi:3-deoxy-D-manno-octulosonic-acid transferase
MRWLRDCAYLTAVSATAPIWAWRMHRTGKLRTDWNARFGSGDALPAKSRPRILVHAVSVGEVNAIRQLVARLAADEVAPDVVVSATTDTGTARAREVFGPAGHAVVRYPFDASWMVERFLDRVRPDLVALTELEVWPNFVDACAARGIPVVVVNGRLSARSFARYIRVRRLLAGTFAQLQAVLAQNQDYADRFLRLGVPAGRVFVTGTMKWDTAQVVDRVPGADELAQELGIDRSRPLIVAGSTAPEEHALLRDATPKGVQLLCAPRKPEWFDAAAETLAGCARRSRGDRGSPKGLFLLDTIGELRKAYALADVVVIGRSFGQLHGSDAMEPAGLGKALVTGLRYGDFQESSDALLRAGAMHRVDSARLPAALRELIADPALRAQMGAAARQTVRANQGATQRTADALLALLPRAAGARDA